MGSIRLILALSVVLNHAYYLFRFNLLGGALAVQAFFIISGFYMSLILNEKYINKPGSYKLFITNRFIRIYPIYLFILIISFLFYLFSSTIPIENISFKNAFENPINIYKFNFAIIDLKTFFFLIFTNLFVFFQDVVMFFSIDNSGNTFFTPDFKLTELPLYKFLLIPQAWSIALEGMFYLIAPFIVRRHAKVIISLIVLTFAARFITYYCGYSNDPWSYRFFPFEIGYFLLGTISYIIYKKIKDLSISPRSAWIPFIFIILLTIAYPVIKFKGSQYIYCLFFSGTLPFVFYLTKNWKYDTYAGELSYPIYLVHILILAVMQYLSNEIHPIFIAFIYLSTVILFSILINEFISKKIEKIRQNRFLKFK